MADNPEYTAEPPLLCKIFPEILGESRGLVLLYQLVQLFNEGSGREMRFHRSMICANCSSCAISSSVMFTMPRNLLNSAGTSLLLTGSSIDSLMKVTTICFCSRVIPCSSAMYGAIGVSLILCANFVIIVIFCSRLQIYE